MKVTARQKKLNKRTILAVKEAPKKKKKASKKEGVLKRVAKKLKK